MFATAHCSTSLTIYFGIQFAMEMDTESNELLKSVMSKFNVISELHIFKEKQVTLSLLKELKPKLGKSCFKEDQAALECFLWVTKSSQVILSTNKT